jgi:hypothetical protein
MNDKKLRNILNFMAYELKALAIAEKEKFHSLELNYRQDESRLEMLERHKKEMSNIKANFKNLIEIIEIDK